MRLGINIDHIATLRNVRKENNPNLFAMANIIKDAGADQITVHLREDRRHIKDSDVKELIENLKIDINLEMALTDEMFNIAYENKPYSVCIVPEKRQELTTEGGLDLLNIDTRLVFERIKILKSSNIKVFLFIDAEEEQIETAAKLNPTGIEIHTGKYSNPKHQAEELKKIQKMAKLAASLGLKVHAGHGLNFTNSVDIIKIKEIDELNIGHFLIAQSLEWGLEKTIKHMINIINTNRNAD